MGFELKLTFALFLELVVSTYFYITVGKALAEYVGAESKKRIFAMLFGFRMIILFLGNVLNPVYMWKFDFFISLMLWIMGIAIKTHVEKEKILYNIPEETTPKSEYKKEVSEAVYKKFGILNPELLKNDLFETFVAYEESYFTCNYNTLSNVCTGKYFNIVSNELHCLESVKPKRIVENFKKENVSITEIHNNKLVQTVTAFINVSYNDYLVDESGKLMEGNKYIRHTKRLRTVFLKYNQNATIPQKCNGCGAPLDKFKGKCEYCGNHVINKRNWKIASIDRIVHEDATKKNPIKMG